MDPIAVLLLAGALAATAAVVPGIVLRRRADRAAGEAAQVGPNLTGGSTATGGEPHGAVAPTASVWSVVRALGWMLGLVGLILVLVWAVGSGADGAISGALLLGVCVAMVASAWWLVRLTAAQPADRPGDETRDQPSQQFEATGAVVDPSAPPQAADEPGQPIQPDVPR